MPDPIGRVLIVDDEPQVAAMLKDVLTMLGHTAQVVGTGPDALRAVPEFQPDVVLLDMTLPGLPGEVVLERLLDAHPRLPVIMLTGNTDPERARQVLLRGAFDYVAKPFNLSRLRQVLEAALASQG
jgi:DNA-binding response OmpR family regulator